ncbi:MAG: hypothetical protein ACYC66_12075, partial [Chloroflexota bacterium]
MSTLASTNSYTRSVRALAVTASVGACLLLFGPLYLTRALAQLHFQAALDPMSPAVLQVMRGLFFHNLFFSQPERYLLAALAAVGLLLVALHLARPGRPMRALLGLTLPGVLAVPGGGS